MGQRGARAGTPGGGPGPKAAQKRWRFSRLRAGPRGQTACRLLLEAWRDRGGGRGRARKLASHRGRPPSARDPGLGAAAVGRAGAIERGSPRVRSRLGRTPRWKLSRGGARATSAGSRRPSKYGRRLANALDRPAAETDIPAQLPTFGRNGHAGQPRGETPWVGRLSCSTSARPPCVFT